MSKHLDQRHYGILVRLPAGDPLARSHLLGEQWTGSRWYASAAERDAALEGMRRQPGNYRQGDTPSVVLDRLDPGTELWETVREKEAMRAW